MKKLRVLVIGSEVSDFLCPMYKKMQERFPMEIELIEPRGEWRNQQQINDSFTAHHKIRFDLKKFSKTEVLKAIFKPGFWIGYLKSFNLKESIRYALLQAQLHPIIDKAAVICFHNLSNQILKLLYFIPENKKSVLSFWGSDLFLNNIDYSYAIQAKALKRASSIIVHSPEMRLIALAKFGWQFEDKIIPLLSTDFSEELQKYIDNKENYALFVASFKQKHNIPENKTIVVVGHSAHDIDNHLCIIPQLGKLDPLIREACFFIFPMTYGNVENYTANVIACCKKHGIHFLIFDEFMSNTDAEELKFASEILVRLSKCDAFSLSLCETLAAGNIVIAASWLPYGNLRAFDVFYKEINDFENLPRTLTEVVAHKEKYRKLSRDNGKKILEFNDAQNSIEKLAKIYRA